MIPSKYVKDTATEPLREFIIKHMLEIQGAVEKDMREAVALNLNCIAFDEDLCVQPYVQKYYEIYNPDPILYYRIYNEAFDIVVKELAKLGYYECRVYDRKSQYERCLTTSRLTQLKENIITEIDRILSIFHI